jgi:hypothetical protein
MAEFQLEFVAQEPGQLVLDVLGFGFRPGEPQEVIVGLCRGRHKSAYRASR